MTEKRRKNQPTGKKYLPSAYLSVTYYFYFIHLVPPTPGQRCKRKLLVHTSGIQLSLPREPGLLKAILMTPNGRTQPFLRRDYPVHQWLRLRYLTSVIKNWQVHPDIEAPLFKMKVKMVCFLFAADSIDCNTFLPHICFFSPYALGVEVYYSVVGRGGDVTAAS